MHLFIYAYYVHIYVLSISLIIYYMVLYWLRYILSKVNFIKL